MKTLSTAWNNQKFFWFLVLSLFFALRIVTLTKSSIWHDEGFTMRMIQFSYAEIVERTARDVHPPLYYFLAKFWTGFFGTTESGIRSLTVLLNLIILPLIYSVVKNLWSNNAAKLSVIFISLSPFMIRFSQEARMWMMIAALGTLATWILFKFLDEEGGIKWLLLYALVLAAALYTQYYTVFIVPVHWFYVAIMSFSRKRESDPRIRSEDDNKLRIIFPMPLFSFRWWAANSLAALFFVPWVRVLLKQVSAVSTGSYWIRPEWMTIRTVPSNIYRFITWDSLAVLGYFHEIILVLILGTIVYTVVKRKDKIKAILFFAGYFLIPMYIVYLYSELRPPIYQERYFTFAAVGFFAFLGTTSVIFKKTAYNTALILVITAGLIYGITQSNKEAPHQMREGAAYVNHNFESGDAVVCGEIFVYFDFSYYNQTGTDCRILGKSFGGFGEASLIYDRPELLLNELTDLSPGTKSIFLVGKTNADYYDKIPLDYSIAEEKVFGAIKIAKYRMDKNGIRK